MKDITEDHYNCATKLFLKFKETKIVKAALQNQNRTTRNGIPYALTASQAANVCKHARRKLGINKPCPMGAEW